MALALVAVLFAAACGGDDGAGPTATPEAPVTTPPPAAETPDAQPTQPGQLSPLGDTTPYPDDRPAAAGDRVLVSYEVALDDGEVIETSEVEIVLGEGALPPAIESALEGVRPGESREVHLTPDEAFGERSEDLVIELPLSDLPEGIEAGDVLQTESGLPALVVEVGDDTATLDVNHPLAGESLDVTLELISVAPAF